MTSIFVQDSEATTKNYEWIIIYFQIKLSNIWRQKNQPIYLFGLVERFSKKVYFEINPRRTKQVLMKIIEEDKNNLKLLFNYHKFY